MGTPKVAEVGAKKNKTLPRGKKKRFQVESGILPPVRIQW